MSVILTSILFIKIYCSKSGVISPFEVVLTSGGWQFYCSETSLVTGKDAENFLDYLRRHEGVSYPCNISAFFEGLWDDIAYYSLHYEMIQERLQELGDWISDCSKQIPRW